MKHRRIKFVLTVAAVVLLLTGIIYLQVKNEEKTLKGVSRSLVIASQETGETYVSVSAQAGDQLSFGWEHSFERIPWNEYYEIEENGQFLLHTISVAGFGAGVPAEMDCTYRYEDGLIYMDGIESEFPQFNWINSKTALKSIELNGRLLIRGEDMPHHEKIVLRIVGGEESQNE